MNKRLLGVLIFAVIVSGGATLLLYRMISSRVTGQSRPATAKVFVAARDLGIGTLVKESDIREAEWTGDIPAQAIPKKEDIVDRGVIAATYAGEPFLQSRLSPKGAGAGLAAIIPPGKRAVAIRVNDVTSVAGFVTPGMRVDVLMLGSPPNSPPALGTQSRTLLQNMEVLSAGQQIERDKEGKPVSVPVVNMLVTPEQAEILSLASQDARIQLVLRNPLDTQEARPPGTALATLWSGQQQPLPAAKPAVERPRPVPRRVVQPPAPPKTEAAKPVSIVIQVLHGAEKKEAKFEKKESEEK